MANHKTLTDIFVERYIWQLISKYKHLGKLVFVALLIQVLIFNINLLIMMGYL